uniref:Dihydrodipicolinate synthase/N-acetylneuraminate lyase n=1 Tax=Candidatus Kentrum sp. MB TaxID=2138164 RepID=A0A451BBB4_9GAMM|nr:MAG: Dihydrodipicolinate synthase/N-acetylneuraminate lyase [Candidatus Kentron sp. MB]VFK31814.1 MAG: Dihydrodipicolinate synthase/N-acetylneuraminate lyase [Candidatus Kentron sp. MB]VFK75581.1 MAG: Dihydrodipicolinate synthase/N-acetylneuraminate lyase [Candidatus Kentron sp. MB]
MKTVNDLIQDPIAHYPKATIACFDPTTGEPPRRQLDERRNIQFLERLAACGVPSVLIGASSGQGHLRTVPELEQWFRCAATARLGATMKTALLRPEDGMEANGHLIELLKTLGYLVVFIRPGTDLPPDASIEDIYANIHPIVEKSAIHGLAVGLYSIPDVSGLPLSPESAAMLVEGQGGNQIVAIKVTEANYKTSTLSFLQHPSLKHLKIIQGWDTHILRALQDGQEHNDKERQRCGITSGAMAFAVYQYLHILQYAEQQNWNEIDQAQLGITALFEAMQDDPRKFPDLQRAKYIMGLGHPITGTVSEQQATHVLTALAALPRREDRIRLARSLDIMGDGPYHLPLQNLMV